MRRPVVVDHSIFVAAPPSVVQAQFTDLQHHIDTNVHPKLRFELLAQEPRRARFTQEVKLLGLRQRDLIDRRIDEDGTIHDESIDGFNKGAKLDFSFRPATQGERAGTQVDIRIRISTPPLMGFLAPLLRKQVLKETMEAAEQDRRDIEGGYRPAVAPA
jgi:hypothetical protein